MPDTGRRLRQLLGRRARGALDALEHLVGGFGTGVLALAGLILLLVVLALCVVGIGIVLLPSALRAVHVIADRERARLNRWGPDLIGPDPPPMTVRGAITSPTVHREVAWLLWHGSIGVFIGVVAITMGFDVVVDGTFPIWYRWVPYSEQAPSIALWHTHDQVSAFTSLPLSALWATLMMTAGPAVARFQAWPGRVLLKATSDLDLSLRVAELTATRAAALDAHATELRRIERSLHDGTQNRLVAVTVLLGAAKRALTRNPADAEEMLERAQTAAETALVELRTVVRGILPPVIEERGLAGALTGLSATSGVPCTIDVDVPGRCAASVEATAYFVVAEALTNVAKHSEASRAHVVVRRTNGVLALRIEDDGRGGAEESSGSGLTGIRRRIEAFDGTLTLSSPPGGPTILRAELPCGS
jgi:signal transduction histidine kinase